MRKNKVCLSLSPAERRLLIDAMLHFRNKVLSRGIDTVDIDRILNEVTK